MAGEKQLSDARSDGLFIGQSTTDKVGFYGTTPAAQPSSASQASVSMQTTATTTALRTDLDNTATLVNQLRSELVTLGLIKGSS